MSDQPNLEPAKEVEVTHGCPNSLQLRNDRNEDEENSEMLEHELTPDDAAIADLNQEHAFIMVAGKARILNERDGSFSSTHDFRSYYANQRLLPNGEKPAPYWLEHEGRRTYSGLQFSPGEDLSHTDIYNLWTGWPVRPDKHSKCDLYLEHIREVICSGDAELYDYVLAWMANAVQKPQDRPGVALALRGKRGTGKGFFVNEFGGLFGKHYVHLSNSRQLTGQFNRYIATAQLVFSDEAFWGVTSPRRDNSRR
jgi:hypothetical protein